MRYLALLLLLSAAFAHSQSVTAIPPGTTLSNCTSGTAVPTAATLPCIAQTAAETTAAVTPVTLGYGENDIRRYAALVGSGNATVDAAAWTAANAVAAVNGRPVTLAGLTLTFNSGIVLNLGTHGIECQGAVFNFSGMTGSANALTITTGNYGIYYHPFEGGCQLNGPGIGSSVNGISFGNPTGSTLANDIAVRNIFIQGFHYGETWGNQAWNTAQDQVEIYNCLWGVYYPTGLTNSGEDLQLGTFKVFNNTNGIYSGGAEFHAANLVVDYNTNKGLWPDAGGIIAASHMHLESNYDNDYWLYVSGAGSAINIASSVISNFLTGKTAYPVGRISNANSSISLGQVALYNGFSESMYNFGFLIDGYGTINGMDNTQGTLGGNSYDIVIFAGNNLLSDGGFEKSTVVDWNPVGGVKASVSTAQHYTATYTPTQVALAGGTQSLAMAPTSGNQQLEQYTYQCSPGAEPALALRLLEAGTATADYVWVYQFFLDINGNNIGYNARNAPIYTSGTNNYATWQRFYVGGGGPAPMGTAYCQWEIGKLGSGGGTSDGNGTLYADDAYMTSIGTPVVMPGTTNYPPHTFVAQTAAFSDYYFTGGFAIEGIRIQNTTANVITGGLNVGTSSTSNTSILSAKTIAANSDIYIPCSGLLLCYFGGSPRQVINFNPVTSWNSASLNVSIFLRRVDQSGY
jgi:hypothetical protein